MGSVPQPPSSTQLADEQPAPDEAPITITFEEGRLMGSGGCNNYRADFTLGEEYGVYVSAAPEPAPRIWLPIMIR